MRQKNFFSLVIKDSRLSFITKILVISDFLIYSGFGLVDPFFAVFASEDIQGGSLSVAGLSSSIYFIVYSLLMIPMARFIDQKKGERDDFLVLIFGSFFICLVPLLYLFARYPWHIYLIQALSGIGFSLAYISWEAIFTRHIDKENVAFSWSIYETLTGLGGALAVGAGGVIIEFFGFRPLFLIAALIVFFGSSSLLFVADKFKAVKQR
ncbi:MAG: MFS transporter [Patescibacteria group bacterium]